MVSLDIASNLMKDRKPLTENEKPINKYLLKAAECLHGSSKVVKNDQKFQLSNNSTARRCTLLAQNLKHISKVT